MSNWHCYQCRKTWREGNGKTKCTGCGRLFCSTLFAECYKNHKKNSYCSGSPKTDLNKIFQPLSKAILRKGVERKLKLPNAVLKSVELREKRENLLYSQEEFVEKLNEKGIFVTKNDFVAMENGDKAIPEKIFDAIAFIPKGIKKKKDKRFNNFRGLD